MRESGELREGSRHLEDPSMAHVFATAGHRAARGRAARARELRLLPFYTRDSARQRCVFEGELRQAQTDAEGLIRGMTG
jgi:hypothetical protein